MWFECVAVGVAERDGEFFAGVRDVVADGLGGEIETTGVVCQSIVVRAGGVD